ncbi:aminotransferase class IV [Filimonas effusa]|uniref:branched-chain-amino-acid transaminase n=1 Tax=Filimonas effusa TaxID=2508721 RepID=A0A4Q1D0S5_9BACT|nr:aminotransferase class IV [Filimonas effusa]RXK81339.1 hypothetical protein ESB13_20600 [Filimonas effusa]
MPHINFNGTIATEVAISPDSRGFKFGDGFFETIKMVNGKMILASYHFDRLFQSLQLLQFQPPPSFNANALHEQVLKLTQLNGHAQHARIRITVFRGNGGLYDPENHLPNYLIQSWPLQPATWNEHGITIGIFRDACKPADKYASVKSNNYLGYAMAALWAQQHNLHDALLLNAAGRITDATIANVFIVHEGTIKTPPLSEGCVNGVMRRHLLGMLKSEGMSVEETPVTETMLLEASECFLTNVISGIRPVRTLKNNTFRDNLSAMIYNTMIKPQLW